ncbi:MAG: biopolymer transporter ExbD [Rubricella sp.]
MRLERPLRRRRFEPAVPMINVVFLLLVFFLMTATLAPPDPVAVTLPDAPGGAGSTDATRAHVTATGVIHYAGREGPAALAALRTRAEPVTLHADRALPATRLVELVAAAGDGPPLLLAVVPE